MARTRWHIAVVAAVASAIMVLVAAGAQADDRSGRGNRAKASAAREAAAKDPVRSEEALLVQVLLDRAGFSVGEIDGNAGAKTKKALMAFQTAKALPASGMPDAAT